MKHMVDLGKYPIRTDLITEILENKESQGFKNVVIMEEDIKVNEVILEKDGASALKKKEGNYITIEFDDVTDKDNYKKVSQVFEKYLKRILKKNKIQKDSKFLIVGLGNEQSTPDSLGPKALDFVLVTRPLFFFHQNGEGYRETSVLKPGVFGSSGIETADRIAKVVELIHPDFILVIDALASSSIQRVNKTIQITDTGIHPGSGIGNDRKEISKESLKVPVIAIGIPTVVDAATIVTNTIFYLYQYFSYSKKTMNHPSNKLKVKMENYLEKAEDLEKEEKKMLLGLLGGLEEEELRSLIKDVLTPIDYNFMVTPKEIDFVVSKLSKLIGEGINKVLHKNYE